MKIYRVNDYIDCRDYTGYRTLRRRFRLPNIIKLCHITVRVIQFLVGAAVGLGVSYLVHNIFGN